MRVPRSVLEAERSRLQEQVCQLEDLLARTQEWMERWQGAAAGMGLREHEMGRLIADADSFLGLVVHRYRATRVPADLVEEMDGWRRRLAAAQRRWGRGETGNTAGDAGGVNSPPCQ